MIRTEKTVYDEPESSDGRRILVMRIWPRGVSKKKVDTWMKDLGSPEETIGKWRSGRMTWSEFVAEYRKSLRGKEGLLKSLAAESKRGTITLLCSDRDASRCHRTLLKKEIERYA